MKIIIIFGLLFMSICAAAVVAGIGYLFGGVTEYGWSCENAPLGSGICESISTIILFTYLFYDLLMR